MKTPHLDGYLIDENTIKITANTSEVTVELTSKSGHFTIPPLQTGTYKNVTDTVCDPLTPPKKKTK